MNEWISVKDRLPENGQAVLVYAPPPKGTMLRADARPLNRCWLKVFEYVQFRGFCDGYCEPEKWVTHWMPLPAPPKHKLPQLKPCIIPLSDIEKTNPPEIPDSSKKKERK